MNQVVRILMERDQLSRSEAEARVYEVREMMEEVDFAYNDCEDIMLQELRLEMDYIFDIFVEGNF